MRKRITTNVEDRPNAIITEAAELVQANTVRQAEHHASPTLNQIRDLAYAKWESAGRPPGDNLRFWLEAEKELLQSS